MIEALLSLKAHNAAVAAISDRVQKFYKTRTPFRIYHGSTNSTRKSQYRADNIVDTSKMNHVLVIDCKKRLALVEPNVPMDKLVDETLNFGLIPPVVMEFPGITVGGGFAGTSGESSSFRHGFIDRTVKYIEIVLVNGDVLYASEESHIDLFHGAASSFGTLGVVTLLALELMPAKQYVVLSYIKVRSMQEAIQKIKVEEKNPELDYLDGMFFGENHGVLCFGRSTDTRPENTEMTRFSGAWDAWFYKNAEEQSAHRESWIEVIPLKDYLFRYDRGAFWIGKYTFKYFMIPCNRFTRWALDKYAHTRVMYHALHKSGLSDQYIIQDVAIPYEKSAEFLSFLDQKFRHYPLWLCPVRLRGTSTRSSYGLMAEQRRNSAYDSSEPETMLNFGVWAPGSPNYTEFVRWNREFEAKVQDLKGRKWLYAHTYYTEDEFWSIYDRKQYDELRGKYHATHLPSLYDKVKVEWSQEEAAKKQNWFSWLYATFWAIWPLSGLYGWLQCIISEEYLLTSTKSVPLERKIEMEDHDGLREGAND